MSQVGPLPVQTRIEADNLEAAIERFKALFADLSVKNVEASLEKVLPIVKERDCAVIGLTIYGVAASGVVNFTVVGFAQATGALAPDDWDDVLAHLPDRKPPRVIGLSVGYRIPAQIMEYANRVMLAATPGLRAPTSVRVGDAAPEIVHSADLTAGVVCQGSPDDVVVDPDQFHGALIAECPVEEVRMGMRVQAVWVPDEEIGPTLQSIKYFKPLDEPDADFDSYKEHL